MNFDWLFYISKVHLNYTREEFLCLTHEEIARLWKQHAKFNGWEIKEDNDENNSNRAEKRVYIDEIPFL
ncbi:hypothetical protein [Clostridium sp. BL-8]|uniref:hypothetical protein n=1 Tax=Clostridium sp. BL-8 TaxID=349938 RepID=UPI00098BFCCC|nr:hypothetical protein [Clostridium sp. BL-8]